MRSIAVEHTITLYSNMQTLTPSQSLNGPPRYDPDDYPDDYPVKDIRGHRKAKGGGIELLVRWHGKNPETNKPWDDSFEPEAGVADDLIDEYFARVRSVESKVVSRVDVRPLFHLARRSLAHAVCLDITRAEPMEHDVPLDALSLEALPSTHPLVGKGWTALPAMQWEVDDDVAVEA